jgi:hypothetical protein
LTEINVNRSLAVRSCAKDMFDKLASSASKEVFDSSDPLVYRSGSNFHPTMRASKTFTA